MKTGVLHSIALMLLLALIQQPLEARSEGKRKNASEPSSGQSATVVERFSGIVTHVSDGDTCDVEIAQGQTLRIRIYGIDAPELAQPYGKESLKYVKRRIHRQKVTVEKFYDDQYGRCVGRVLLNGTDLALELLQEGIVWHYVKYCDDPAYKKAEQQARQAQKGLWKRSTDGEEPIPPWEYRKTHPRRK
ncbi:MAG: thermonuclease family protein [Victivallales bacterium]|nr:thermonuclease family protein [Victivallales bacterium]